jgi:hypothetical protein
LAQFDTIVATTELEAVNTMLSVIGENPITDLDAAAAAETDIEMAVAILRTVMTTVQSKGWRFNTDFEFRIANTTVETEAGFSVPTNMLTFEVTDRTDQRGPRPQKNDDGTLPTTTLLDIAASGVTPLGVRRFYDRLNNTQVFSATDRPQIFIDMVRSVDFTDMPQTARDYCVTVAGRTFAERTIGAPLIVGYTNEDILASLRILRAEQGIDKPRNLLHTFRTYNFVGRRPRRF